MEMLLRRPPKLGGDESLTSSQGCAKLDRFRWKLSFGFYQSLLSYLSRFESETRMSQSLVKCTPRVPGKKKKPKKNPPPPLSEK